MCDLCRDTQLIMTDAYEYPIPCPRCGDVDALIANYERHLKTLFTMRFVFQTVHDLNSFLNLDKDRGAGKADAIVAAGQWLKRGGLLLLTGPSGRGKTTLALACLRMVHAPTLAIDAEQMFDQLRDGYDDHQRNDRFDALFNVTALLIDDIGRLGTGTASPHDTKALRMILDARQQRNRGTIITTNLGQKQLAAQYDQTIVARLSRWGIETIMAYDSGYNGNGWLSMGGDVL